MKTTLNKIRAHHPCTDGWSKLLSNLGKTKPDDEPLAITTILDSNGLDDALWCLRAVDGHLSEMRLYAVDCARSVQHLMKDLRSVAAIDTAERHAYGLATDEELVAARDAAWGAACGAAWGAAWNAARYAARDAAWAASREVQSDLLRIVCAEIEQREVELPEPEWYERKGLIFDNLDGVHISSSYDKLFTLIQLRDYGDRRAAAERERCAEVCFEAEDSDDEYVSTRQTIAKAIRAGGGV